MIAITWTMTGIAIIGTIANSYQKKIGFIFWLISNIFWIGLNIKEGIYAQAAVYAFNSIMCIVGMRQWSKQNTSTNDRKDENND